LFFVRGDKSILRGMNWYSINKRFRSLVLAVRDRLTPQQFFILASIVVGLSSALVSVMLKSLVHFIGHQVAHYSQANHVLWMLTFLPLIGILLTVLYVQRFLKDPLLKGSAEIKYFIARHSSILPKSQMYSHVVSSALTVGLGGSTGLESPIVSTGSAIGSNFGKVYSFGYKERTVLLACGVAAGIAAVFNAPIAGVLFAIEAVLTDISITAFIPLIIAAATGALISKIILQEGVVMSFTLRQPFDYHNVPFYIFLGIVCGVMALYHARIYTWTEHMAVKMKNPWVKATVFGLSLALLISFFPTLFGEGYTTIKLLAEQQPQMIVDGSLMEGWIRSDFAVLIFVMLVMLAKSFAAGFTLAGGGNGGNFGPSLFVGAYLGFAFARMINLSGIAHLPETNFILVAMAGLLSGVFYAPLSAIFLIAEITGGYELMIPLMMVSALSLAVVKYFRPLSMEAVKLATKLKHSVETKDQFLLSKLELNKLIEKDFAVLHPDQTLAQLVEAISKTRRNTFPVVGAEDQLVGIIHLDHVRTTIFQFELHDSVKVKDLMTAPSETISLNDTVQKVLKKFDDAHQWNLPVIEEGKYIGFVSKSSILSKYREELLHSF
jgi:CIC family chloride channel protein